VKASVTFSSGDGRGSSGGGDGRGSSGAESSAATPDPPMTLDELRRMLAELARAIRLKLGDRAAVLIAAGFPIDGDHDRFASFVTGPCLTSRGLLAWSERSIEKQIDESDTSIDEHGRVR
jgi:hypothetical protein